MGAAPGQWNLQGGVAGRGGDYQGRAARSRNGGLVGGVWASGGRRKQGGAGRGTGSGGGGLGGGGVPTPSPDSGVNAWWQAEAAHQWGGGSRGGSGGGGGGSSRIVGFPKRHEFLRRSHPTATTATYARSSLSLSTHKNGRATANGRLPRPGGGVGNGRDPSAAAAAAAGVDAFWPRTQILGMNGGRLPRKVRQVPVDRPLTAPCGKVGRRRVRTPGGGGSRGNSRTAAIRR